ncbi:calcium homeostasis endoplasmic reticulum protein isoform X1 [Nematostella vectensis]|uniref:calcium homeostasis endoplasmic reticulum protein isoform X1 n=1 Tax=Nematostella vectensis TaxID=45351 RepID=UPI0020779095|nr:calcium homeostasis endoplasmic reticulum protein isoform X1 [Nematostella vectensis]
MASVAQQKPPFPPPDDQELKNIIDKLANFVARNGSKFEDMTKEKQKNNPKFSFLYSGQNYHNYYRWRVSVEIASNQTQQHQQQTQMVANSQYNKPQSSALVQQALVQQSINSAPWQQQQQQTPPQQVVTAVPPPAQYAAPPPTVYQNAPQPPSDLDFQEFDGMLQKLMDSCTKDAISTGRGWVLNNAKSPQHCHHIMEYILKKCFAPGLTFPNKLHLVYIINDIVHHAARKNLTDLNSAVKEVVVPVFCYARQGDIGEGMQKLTKVLGIWETNDFFDAATLQKLKNPESAKAEVEEVQKRLSQGQFSSNANYQQQQASPIQNEFQAKQAFQQYPNYQQYQQQYQQYYHQYPPYQQQNPGQFPPTAPPGFNQPPPSFGIGQAVPGQPQGYQQEENVGHASHDQQGQSQAKEERPQQVLSEESSEASDEPPDEQKQSDGMNAQASNEGCGQKGGPTDQRRNHEGDPYHGGPFNQALPGFPPRWGPPPHMPPDYRGFPPPNFPPPDFSRPPPNFNDPAFQGRPPPFVRPPPQQFDYQHGRANMDIPPPIDYNHGRPPHDDFGHEAYGPDDYGPDSYGPEEFGPPPVPPPPRPIIPEAMYYELPAGLMAPMVKLSDVDYVPLNPADIRLPAPQPPSERLLAAVEAFYSPPSHESPRNADGWEQSGLFEFYKAKLPFLKQRDLTKKDRPVPPSTPPKKTSPDQSRSRSRSPRSHRSTSRSPRRRHSPSVSPPYRRRSRSRSPQRQRSCSRSRSRSKSRSISPMFRSSDRKSPSPPAFSPFVTKTTETRLDETNVGHQMLKKMGWEGAGLGKNERGIQNPIQAGEVRERHNMYKGIGVEEDDVFDKFRYKRSYTYNRPVELPPKPAPE